MLKGNSFGLNAVSSNEIENRARHYGGIGQVLVGCGELGCPTKDQW